jgi:23S rRNA pseudouridine1911/1915/1917 synthase
MNGDISCYGAEAPLVKPGEFPSWILREDDDLLVVNKPAGSSATRRKTARGQASWARARILPERAPASCGPPGPRDQRLVLLARNRKAAGVLQQAFENRMTTKTYLAVLEGELHERQEVSRALEDDPTSAVAVKQRVSTDGTGVKAQTTFIPLAHGGGFTLCKVRPHTGRKHQIRVHAQWLGHPIAGDKLYGRDETLYLEFTEHGLTPRLQAALALPRQALHAWKLEMHAPGAPQEALTAPLWDDMRLFMKEVMGLEEVPDASPATNARRRRRLAEG